MAHQRTNVQCWLAVGPKARGLDMNEEEGWYMLIISRLAIVMLTVGLGIG
jgi:hypothetical protein